LLPRLPLVLRALFGILVIAGPGLMAVSNVTPVSSEVNTAAMNPSEEAGKKKQEDDCADSHDSCSFVCQ
jgi:hypothetical protein